jgi:hypothetical protein
MLAALLASAGCNGVPFWKWALIGAAMFVVLYISRQEPKKPKKRDEPKKP